MCLKKNTDLFKNDNTGNDDILILEGNVTLEPLKSTVFMWESIVGHKEKNLEFEKAFRIEHQSYDTGIRGCTYTIHGREFTDLSFMAGENVVEIDHDHKYASQYELGEYADGKKVLFCSGKIPTFDSGDREWYSGHGLAIYYDEAGVNIISSSYGYKIANIGIYLGLRRAHREFELFVKYLQCPDFGIHYE